MSGLNTVLVTLSSNETISVPIEYFEIYAIIINVLPVLWSKILDESKTYLGSITPPLTPPTSPVVDQQSDQQNQE